MDTAENHIRLPDEITYAEGNMHLITEKGFQYGSLAKIGLPRAFKKAEFVTGRIPNLTFWVWWCNFTVVNVHAPTKEIFQEQ
jgi:hypothetical protein